MTETPETPNQKEKERMIREARLAKNLRDNLRRRKAATRKTQDKKTSDTGH